MKTLQEAHDVILAGGWSEAHYQALLNDACVHVYGCPYTPGINYNELELVIYIMSKHNNYMSSFELTHPGVVMGADWVQHTILSHPPLTEEEEEEEAEFEDTLTTISEVLRQSAEWCHVTPAVAVEVLAYVTGTPELFSEHTPIRGSTVRLITCFTDDAHVFRYMRTYAPDALLDLLHDNLGLVLD